MLIKGRGLSSRCLENVHVFLYFYSSGKEGVFPDLINTTEDCLRKIKPNRYVERV